MKKLSHKVFNPETCRCSICNVDLSSYGVPKVLTTFAYESFYGRDIETSFDKKLKRLFNGMMCQNCAKKDLEIAHKEATKAVDRETYDELQLSFQQTKERLKGLESNKWVRLFKKLKLIK